MRKSDNSCTNKIFKLKLYTFLLLIICFIPKCNQQSDESLKVSGPYLGQKPPGKTAEIFAPGIISTGHSESIACFSQDGRELYFMLYGSPIGVLLYTKENKGVWTKPKVMPFSSKYNGKYILSPKGNQIVFSSNRPLNGKGKPLDDYYTWIVEKEGDKWGIPKYIKEFEDEEKSFSAYPSSAINGNIYFFSKRKDGIGGEDIYMSRFDNGVYSKPENLGNMINSEYDEIDPFIAPDESYLIFLRRSNEGFGGVDLYISFKNKDGEWTESKNMGSNINSEASEFCPTVTPDGKYMFFTSNRSTYMNYSKTPLSYEEKCKILNGPGNGNSDIYWVDAKIIEDLKPDYLK